MADSTDYDWTDEATKRLARKRQLARLLQEQAMKGMPMPDRTPVSALAPIAQMFQAYMGQRAEDQAAEEGKAQEAARQKAESDAWTTFQAGRQGTPAMPARPDMNLPGDLRDLAGQDYPAAPEPSPLAASMVQDQQQAPPMGAPPAPQVADPMRNPMAQLLAGKPPETPTLGDTMAADQANAPAEGPPLVPQLGAGQTPAEPGIVPKPVDLGKIEDIGKREAPAPAGSDVETAAEKAAGLEPGLLATHRQLERSPNDSVSPKGARGVYQITPANVAEYSRRAGRPLDPTNEADGAYMAAQVAADAKRRYGDNMEARVAYYNGGPAAGDAVAAGQPTNKETTDYVKRYREASLKLPPQGPTPSPTLAGPAVPGAIEQTGDPTNAQWDAMASTRTGTETGYPVDAPPPPALVPQSAAEALTTPPPQPGLPQFLPSGARDMAPIGLQLPAQAAVAKKPLTIEDMVSYANSLPPGQLKNYVQREAMKAAITEPERLEAKRQHDETMAALTGRKIESAEKIATGKNVSAEERARIAAKAGVDRANITAAARGQASTPSLSPDAIRTGVEQYMAGDKSVMQGLGWGGTGAANRAAMREGITAYAKEHNMTGADVAAKIAEFGGLQAAERTVGQRGANIEMAVREASKMADLVIQASESVPRTDFTPANQAINYWNTKTGDPNVRQFGASLNSFINVYARAIGGTSASSGTVNDKEHAREMLNTADSHEQVVAIMARLQKEMETAQEAPKAVRQSLRQEISAGGSAPAGKTIVRRGTAPDGTRVVQYSDGTTGPE